MNSKLERQLSELLAADVITSDTAQKITTFYHAQAETKPNRLLTIFGVLGALLSGLGIILIIAHNWDDLSKNIKTIFAFLPLIIGQIACGYSFIKNKNSTWIEASTTFLILAIGATISLVSQVYNIPGDLSSFLLVWVAVTAPLIYLLRSNMSIIFHLILATWYACDFGYFNASNTPWWYLLLFAVTIPSYIKVLKEQPKSNISGILNWLMPLSFIIALGAFAEGETITVMLYVGLFGLLYNLGQLPIFKNQKLRRNGYSIFGSLGTVILLTFLSFEWFWTVTYNELNYIDEKWITLLIYLAGFSILAFLHFKKQIESFNLFQYAFLITAVLYLLKDVSPELMMILANLLIAALGLFAIRLGVKKNSYGILNYGLLIITLLIICRFFDSNINFIVKGVLFIVVGIGFFFTNYLLLKKQRNTSQNTVSKTQNHE